MIKNTASAIVDHILASILAGELRCGDEIKFSHVISDMWQKEAHVPGSDIRQTGQQSLDAVKGQPRTGQKRGPFRVAMSTLKSIGVVKVTKGKGTRVRKPTDDEILTMAALRASVETSAITELVRRVQAGSVSLDAADERMKAMHGAMWQTAHGPPLGRFDVLHFVRLDELLHVTICKLAGMWFVVPMVRQLFWAFVLKSQNKWPSAGHAMIRQGLSEMARRTWTETCQQVWAEHQQIISALRDQSVAGEAMYAHIYLAARRAISPGTWGADVRPAYCQTLKILLKCAQLNEKEIQRNLDKRADRLLLTGTLGPVEDPEPDYCI